MYKHILVAVDDSDTSKSALYEAIKLTKVHQPATLRIIHVVDEYLDTQAALFFDPKTFDKSLLKLGQKVLDQMQGIARKEGIEVESRLLEIKTSRYKVAEKIVEEAKTWPADVLVLGTHGRRGFHHFLLGSVAEGVIRIAPMPVLLIRGKEAFKS
jgi:nucleotide-binding universal stress UspA family protein